MHQNQKKKKEEGNVSLLLSVFCDWKKEKGVLVV
jgi:hypothetical protein